MSPGFALFPRAASTIASQVDQLTLALVLVCGGMLALVFGLIVAFGVLYRKGSSRSRVLVKRGESALEWGWTLLTLGVFLCIFAWGAYAYFEQHSAPPGAQEIQVVAKQWMWKFQHPNGRRELDELHVPVGKPVLLTMTSADVIHSFYVPEFRIKQDVLPGRYTRTWFEATRPGEYHLFCTQYCGLSHAQMKGVVHALTPEDYARWLATGATLSPRLERVETLSSAARGSRLFTRLGCISCHGQQPAGVRAPSLRGLYGSQVELTTGAQVTADEDYLRESILNPQAKITKGYDAVMPAFAGVATEEDVLDLIAFIKQGAPR